MASCGFVLVIDAPQGQAWLDLGQVASAGGNLAVAEVPAGWHRIGVDDVFPASAWVRVRPGLVATRQFDTGMLLDAQGFRVAQLQGLVMTREIPLIDYPLAANQRWEALTAPLQAREELPRLLPPRKGGVGLHLEEAFSQLETSEALLAELAWSYLVGHLDADGEALARWRELFGSLGTSGAAPADLLAAASPLVLAQLQQLGPTANRPELRGPIKALAEVLVRGGLEQDAERLRELLAD